MQTRIVKWGNSQGIRIPKAFLQSLQLEENDIVDLIFERDKIIISKRKSGEHKTTKERLLDFYGSAKHKKHSSLNEIDWGESCRKRDMIKQGDIIWLDFCPQNGHEQKGRQPVLVVSNNTFNNFSNLAIVCPIISTNKDYPFHVKLDERTKTTGVILSDQARTLDIRARNYAFIEKIPDDILFEVIDIIGGFIEVGNDEGAPYKMTGQTSPQIDIHCIAD
jgi:mRNA interferase MazF